MHRKPLFLRWTLINLLTLVLLGLAWYYGQQYFWRLHVIGQIMCGVVLLLFVIMTSFAAKIAWRADILIQGCNDFENANYRFKVGYLRHRAVHIAYAANEAPYVGLMGALLGFVVFFGDTLPSTDASRLKEMITVSMAAIGVAFMPTLTGVFVRIILRWQHHLVDHALKGSKYEVVSK